MRAPTMERVISIMALVLVISVGFLVPKAAAQSDKYSKMAPVNHYFMEREAEILLARSAAPDSSGRLKATKVGIVWMMDPKDLDAVKDRKVGRPRKARKASKR
ncbi:MAG TPA: hypothetical protein VFH31_21295 [Pyrinomonadaceae bacterium]|nr:hypothetical protein [Pyrinomonadaceae bacterium]